MKKQTPRKKHSGRSVVWGKVILPTIFNIETQEEEDGKEVRAMGVIRYDNLVREKNLNPFAKIRND